MPGGPFRQASDASAGPIAAAARRRDPRLV